MSDDDSYDEELRAEFAEPKRRRRWQQPTLELFVSSSGGEGFFPRRVLFPLPPLFFLSLSTNKHTHTSTLTQESRFLLNYIKDAGGKLTCEIVVHCGSCRAGSFFFRSGNPSQERRI